MTAEVERHELIRAVDQLTCIIHPRCTCGLLYPAVTQEHEVRERVLDGWHDEHLKLHGLGNRPTWSDPAMVTA